MHIQLYCNGRALCDAPAGAAAYPLRSAIDDMLVYFSNDIQSLALMRDRPNIVVDYRDVSARFGEVARHIGSAASEGTIAEIVARPLMKKLPRLDQYVAPLEPLVAISDVLNEAFERCAAGEIASQDAWRWGSNNVALIKAPGFDKALYRFGIETPASRNGVVEWRIGKPMLMI